MALKISIIPYIGIRFLAITRPFFVRLVWFFLVIQETIIYRLVMRNRDFDAFLENILFWRENGRGRRHGTKGSGASRPDQRVGQMGQPFGSTVNSKTSFKNFGPEVGTWIADKINYSNNYRWNWLYLFIKYF